MFAQNLCRSNLSQKLCRPNLSSKSMSLKSNSKLLSLKLFFKINDALPAEPAGLDNIKNFKWIKYQTGIISKKYLAMRGHLQIHWFNYYGCQLINQDAVKFIISICKQLNIANFFSSNALYFLYMSFCGHVSLLRHLSWALAS